MQAGGHNAGADGLREHTLEGARLKKLLLGLLLLVPLLLVLRARGGGHDGERVEITQQWPVMGTFLGIRSFAPDSAHAEAASRAGQAAVFRVDSLMSTWKPESEISRLNRSAGTGEWTPLSAETLAVLLAARTLAAASGGAFDVTVGPLMQAWGFRGGRQARPSAAMLDSARSLVDYRLLELDSAGSRARLARPGVAVDLGAIAKGYALDVGRAAMERAGATAGMLDLGGNVLVFGAPPEGRPEWVIGILDPRDPEGTIGTVRLVEGSVATSGDYEQFFEVDGVRYSHIMDARTGVPSRGTLQTTVVAPTGLQSDGFSTTLFVLGPDSGRALLPRLPFARGVTAVWVRDALPLDRADIVVAGSDSARVSLGLKD